jgi:hypothetical protein
VRFCEGAPLFSGVLKDLSANVKISAAEDKNVIKIDELKGLSLRENSDLVACNVDPDGRVSRRSEPSQIISRNDDD